MSRQKPAPKELWSYNQISDHTGITAATLRVWRTRGHLPAPDFTVGEYLIWKPDTIKQWWTQREDRKSVV